MSNTVGEIPGIVVLFSWNSMCDIIYIGYDVINILDVMSYLYGCDVIMYSCDVMHTECDVIDLVCNVIQRVGEIQLIHWVWWHRYSGCSVKYRGWDGRYNFMLSCVWCRVYYVWCHECSRCNVVTTMVWSQRVDVTLCMVHKMSYIKWVWCHTNSCSEIILRGIVRTQILWMQF